MSNDNGALTAGCFAGGVVVVAAAIFGTAFGVKSCRQSNKKYSWEDIKKSSFCLIKENQKSKYFLVKQGNNGKYEDLLNEDLLNNKKFDVNSIIEYHSAEVYFIQKDKIQSEYSKDDLRSVIEQFNQGTDNYVYSDDNVIYTWNCIEDSYVGIYKNDKGNTVCILRDNDGSYSDLINNNSVKESDIINLHKAQSLFVESGNLKSEYTKDDLINIVSTFDIDNQENKAFLEKTKFTWDDIKNSYVGIVNKNGSSINTLLNSDNGQYIDILSSKKVDDDNIISCDSAVPYFVQTDNVKVEYTKDELKTIVAGFKIDVEEYTTDNSRVKVKK